MLVAYSVIKHEEIIYLFIYSFIRSLSFTRFKGLRQKFPKYLDGWKKIYDSNVSHLALADYKFFILLRRSSCFINDSFIFSTGSPE